MRSENHHSLDSILDMLRNVRYYQSNAEHLRETNAPKANSSNKTEVPHQAHLDEAALVRKTRFVTNKHQIPVEPYIDFPASSRFLVDTGTDPYKIAVNDLFFNRKTLDELWATAPDIAAEIFQKLEQIKEEIKRDKLSFKDIINELSKVVHPIRPRANASELDTAQEYLGKKLHKYLSLGLDYLPGNTVTEKLENKLFDNDLLLFWQNCIEELADNKPRSLLVKYLAIFRLYNQKQTQIFAHNLN